MNGARYLGKQRILSDLWRRERGTARERDFPAGQAVLGVPILGCLRLAAYKNGEMTGRRAAEEIANLRSTLMREPRGGLGFNFLDGWAMRECEPCDR